MGMEEEEDDGERDLCGCSNTTKAICWQTDTNLSVAGPLACRHRI